MSFHWKHWCWSSNTLATCLRRVDSLEETLMLEKIESKRCNFLEETSSLSHSVVFLLFLCIDHWGRFSYLSLLFFGTLHSDAYLSFSPLLFTSLLFTAICKASPDSHFAFLDFFSMGMVLIPVSYTVSQTSVHSSSGTLSIRSNPLNLFFSSTA